MPKKDETYLGDGVYATYTGSEFILQDRNGNICKTTSSAMLQIEQFVRSLKQEKNTLGNKETDVLCEDDNKYYRAMLIRELTLDEIYQRVAKS